MSMPETLPAATHLLDGLEFGPGGSIHRTTSVADSNNSNTPAAAIVSLWNALHKQSSSSPSSFSSMSTSSSSITKWPEPGMTLELCCLLLLCAAVGSVTQISRAMVAG